MAGINRIHGSVVNPASLNSGYALKFFKIAVSGITLAADTVDATTGAITEGNFTKAIRVVQNTSSIIYLGVRANAQFVCALDGATAGVTGAAFDSDTSPSTAERLKADLEAALSGSTFTVTDISNLASGDLA
jgi:hypothetical protein